MRPFLARSLLVLVACVLCCLSGAKPLLAGAIPPSQQLCGVDADCGLVALTCPCLCGGVETYDAANNQFAAQYKYLERCSEHQTRVCAETTCNAAKTPVAVCKNKQCAVVWHCIKGVGTCKDTPP